jgi:ActR/RegA family two-component response regulator
MSNGHLVLIMNGHYVKNLVRPLAEWGYSAIVVDHLTRAVHQAQHLPLSAAIINGNGTIDILEFVLSIRDIDDTLPIIVVRASIAERVENALRGYPEVYFVTTMTDDLLSRIYTTLDRVTKQ